MKTFRDFISESKDGHIYVVHGGSDFDNIDLKHSGRGEPGNIRPLGPGLYGYHVPTDNDEEAHHAISWAQRYGTKYGRSNKTLHVFKVPRTATLGMNHSQHHVGDFAKPEGGNPQMRAERLPIGATEVSVLDPTVATRVGKFPIDTPPHEILNHIKNHKG